jgi:hypothetical protein
MMNQFDEIIYMDSEALSFHFSLIHTTKGVKIFVTVVKDRGYFVFDMQKDGSGKWKILDPAPIWVKPFAGQLGDVINKNI